MVEDAVMTKEAGQPMETLEPRLSRALPMFDVHSYVEEFGATVVPEYLLGKADRGHAADNGLARSIIPPATAATRDFSSLAPQIPQLVADACVGCMACVNACPDTAILATVQPRAELNARIGDAAELNAQFAFTQKYATVPERKGIEPGMFGIFVDPMHCKGCGECVEVCAHVGHDALRMIDKEPETRTAPSTLDSYRRQID